MGQPWLPLPPSSPALEAMDEIHKEFPAEQEDTDHIFNQVREKHYDIRPEPGSFAMLQAIDAATGDSTLHSVARQGFYRGYLQLLKPFHQMRAPYNQWTWDKWAEHALITHPNHSGDTVLHVAAREGNQTLVTAIYRQFHNHASCEVPDELEIADAPELRKFPEGFIPDGSDPALRFLISTNKKGKTAEDVAREADHLNVAQWFHDVLIRLDPDGSRRTGEGVRRLNEVVEARFRYKEMIGEEYH